MVSYHERSGDPLVPGPDPGSARWEEAGTCCLTSTHPQTRPVRPELDQLIDNNYFNTFVIEIIKAGSILQFRRPGYF